MPNLRNYQEYTPQGWDRPLTEREVRALRKFGGIAGRRLIDDVKEKPSHKLYDYVLSLWNLSKENGHRQRSFKELLCDVPAGTFDSWCLSQGLQQKQTFRMNAFERNMDYLRETLRYGSWKGLPIVWRVQTDLSAARDQYSNRSFRHIPNMYSYVVANSGDEAASIWGMMVLSPIGIVKSSDTRDYRRLCEPRFVGPQRFCEIAEQNKLGLSRATDEISKQITSLETALKEMHELKALSEMAFALGASTLLMANGGLDISILEH